MKRKYIRNGRPWYKSRMKRTFAQFGLFLFFTAYVFIPLSAWLKSSTTIVLAAEPVTVMPVSATIIPSPVPDAGQSQDSGEGDEYEETKAYIYEVFGKEGGDKSMLLLKGNGKCGGENGSLKRNAVNTAGNTPKGSRDIGVYQINEYWQGVNAKFLFDWKLNIQIAYKIYTDSGNTFKMWTGGKCQGI